MNDSSSTSMISMASVLADGFRIRKDDTLRVFKILDFNEMYAQAEAQQRAVILNRFDFSSPGYSERLQDHVFSRSSDIDFIAKCECEHLNGSYWEGTLCPKCNTIATSDMEAASGHLTHRTWLSCPKELKGGWIHPAFYGVLSRWLRYGKRVRTSYTNTQGEIANRGKLKKGNYLDDILDPETPINEDLIGFVTGSGFDYFYENFDYLIDFFANHFPKTANRKNISTLLYFIKQNRHKVFTRYLPILSSSLHPIVMSEGQSESRRRFVDKNSQYVLSAAATLSTLEFSTRRKKRSDEVECAAFAAFQEMIAYTSDIAVKQLSKKKSLPRQHMFGSRLHFTFRGVIVPITGPHAMDEVHLPSNMASNLLRDHTVGRLMQQGMTAGEALSIQEASLQRFDERVHKIMLDLIAESPQGKLPILFNRNPSIRSGSIQQLWVTKIKTNIEDESIGFSAIICADPNADFDGDELNGVLIMENAAVESFAVMHPHRRYLSRNSLNVSSTIGIPKALTVVANTFLGMV